MLSFDEARRWKGRVMLDRDDNKVGTISEIYLDEERDQPGWALVSTGLPGAQLTLVPLVDAIEDANEIRVPYDRTIIQSAPSMEEGGRLTPQEEAELYQHYGLEYSAIRWDEGVIIGGMGIEEADLLDFDDDEEDDFGSRR